MHHGQANGPVVPAQGRTRIFAVIVLYRQAAANSATLRTLLASADHAGADALDLRILLYDNTAGAQAPTAMPREFVQYRAAPANRGLAGAYNEALTEAEAEGFPWLLTLDQDTELPLEYLSVMARLASECTADERIAAIVPHLVDRERVLSPVRVHFWTHTPLPLAAEGVVPGEVQALNSAALLRTSGLREIGGFHPLFWLNYLDNWLYYALNTRGKRIYVAPRLVIQHELSLLDYRDRMTIAHYEDFLLAESAFRDLYRGGLAGLAYTAQLAVRLRNQKRRREKAEILQATRAFLRRRLTTTRRQRISEWERKMRTREAAGMAEQVV